jgi:hypothetical protein
MSIGVDSYDQTEEIKRQKLRIEHMFVYVNRRVMSMLRNSGELPLIRPLRGYAASTALKGPC